jgi:hypothetical protein
LSESETALQSNDPKGKAKGLVILHDPPIFDAIRKAVSRIAGR